MSHALEKRPTVAASAPRRPRRRRAMATLVVLLLISITLALSYSIMRSQSTAMAIQRNANLRREARLAAMAGINAGLKRMHVWDEDDSSQSWAGVGTTLAARLSPTQRFEVRFATGDPSLTVDDPWLLSDRPTLVPSHPDRNEFPLRVTLFSTGYATDPSDPSREAAHRVRAVVRLVPRKLADEPAGWAEVLEHTVYQWTKGSYEVDVPFRIEGPQRIQNALELGKNYPWPNEARWRFLTDLNAMTAAASIDFRPFDGLLRLPYRKQEDDVLDILKAPKAVPTEDVEEASLAIPASPGETHVYQLYPGGKEYRAGYLPRGLHSAALGPDPVDNPLGLFQRAGEAYLYDNVTIQGTLITRGSSNGDVHFEGRNIRLLPVELPPLAGSKMPICLPVVVAEDDLRFHSGTQAIITGMLTMLDEFHILPSEQDGFSVSGTARITIKSPSADDHRCTLESVDLNTVDPRLVPIGAKFRISTPGNSTVYTVTKRTPEEASPTESIEFTPSWGRPTPAQGDEIRFVPATSDTVVTIRGRVVAKKILVEEHPNWVHSSWWWREQYEAFMEQLEEGEDSEAKVAYFPVWLQKVDSEMVPWSQSTIKPRPAASGPAYDHWKNPYDPIYVPHPDDGGLRWELLEWTDNP